jgi:Fur family transcriptional regulator, iron response regulator
MTAPMASLPRADQDRVLGLLREHCIVPTAQRVTIGRILFARDQHLTAEDLLTALRAEGQRVSKATVYNTLNLFAAKGLLRTVNAEAGRSAFDSNTRPHFHFHVAETGELIDVAPGEVEFARLPALPPGTESLGVEVVIRLRRKP